MAHPFSKRLILIIPCLLALLLVEKTTSHASGFVGSCSVFPANNAWNRDISADPVDPNSDNYIATIGASTKLHPDFGSNPSYGIPYTVVSGTQPKVPINFTSYGSQSDPGPYPFPLNAPVEAGSDGHSLVIDKDNCVLYELYQAQQSGAGWNAASGAVYDLNSNQLRPDGWTSADAAGLPIFPGLARYDEATAGAINHALRFTVVRTQKKFIHPATHYASSSTNPNDPPMGLRLRLKASYNISGFTGESRVILTALKKYGMIVADNGSNWFISGVTDTRWDDNDLNQIKTVPGGAFEVVQTIANAAGPIDTVGIYRPANHTFYLSNSNTAPAANIVAALGNSGAFPVVGDWDGDGFDTAGLYYQNVGVFNLYDSNTPTAAITRQFVFGNPNDIPISGRWVTALQNDPVGSAGKFHDGVGVFRPSNGLIYLISAWPQPPSLTVFADYTIVLGNPGWRGLAGKWTGGILDTAAVYRFDTSRFYMTSQSCNGIAPGPNVFCLQFSTHDVFLGSANDIPIKGDWIGSGMDGIGVYHNSTGVFSLLNSFPAGSNYTAAVDTRAVFGSPGDIPLAGHWKQPGSSPSSDATANMIVSPASAKPAHVTPAPDDGHFD